MIHEDQMIKLIEIVKDADWSFAIPEGKDEDVIKGMIIGEPAYIKYVLKHLD